MAIVSKPNLPTNISDCVTYLALHIEPEQVSYVRSTVEGAHNFPQEYNLCGLASCLKKLLQVKSKLSVR